MHLTLKSLYSVGIIFLKSLYLSSGLKPLGLFLSKPTTTGRSLCHRSATYLYSATSPSASCTATKLATGEDDGFLSHTGSLQHSGGGKAPPP